MKPECTLCGTEWQRRRGYDDDDCPTCGAKHCWDEGFMLSSKWAAAEIERLQADVDSLNALLRGVGWGQGEIDSSASFAERYEQLEAVVDAVKKYAEAMGHVWPKDWAEYEAQWHAVVEEVGKLSKAAENPSAPEDPGV